MNKLKSSLLFFYTETSLHAGSGAGVGAIDLPLQRERMSDLPQVQGSGVKGALRELFRSEEEDKRELEEILFGPRPPDASSETDKSKGDDAVKESKAAKAHEHAGALAVTDARLLLLPVRTAHGGWAWITSPLILQRLARDLCNVQDGGELPSWASLKVSDKALVAKPDVAITSGPRRQLVIEDALYETEVNEELMALAEFIGSGLPPTPVYQSVRDRLPQQLAVLSDEEMCYWARHGTEVVTRVRIDPNTGTVAKGALWTEEALPSESLLWSMIMVSDSRKKGCTKVAKDLQQDFLGEIKTRGRTFLGGDRTVGRGLVALGQIGGNHGTAA